MQCDNDFPHKIHPQFWSSPLKHGDIIFPLPPTPGWAGLSKMPIITQNSQPICNYAADNDLPSASTVGLILLTNMPDGANW